MFQPFSMTQFLYVYCFTITQVVLFLFLIPPYYKWGVQIYFTVPQYDIYFVIFLDYTLRLLIYCSYKALTWNAFSQKKNYTTQLAFL